MLISAANKAQIRHVSKPSLSPPEVLLEWSKLIADHFQVCRRCASVKDVRAAGGSVGDGVALEMLCKIAERTEQIE